MIDIDNKTLTTLGEASEALGYNRNHLNYLKYTNSLLVDPVGYLGETAVYDFSEIKARMMRIKIRACRATEGNQRCTLGSKHTSPHVFVEND